MATRILLAFILFFCQSHLHVLAWNTDVFAIIAGWTTNPSRNPWVYMESTIIIPPVPSKDWQTLYIWPGLQPLYGHSTYNPIGNGVLQPVLTWGDGPAPNPTQLEHEGWWISPQYVNTYTSLPAYSGCFGGNRLALNPGNIVTMIMELLPGTTTWRQTVINRSTSQVSTFDMDLHGQAQGIAEFVMEIPGGWHGSSGVPKWSVTNIILKTDGSGRGRGFCEFEPRLMSPDRIPGGSLDCAQPVKDGNKCMIPFCNFNIMS